jgi:alpha-tubulin suppressor-like RCC1 family protein
MHIVGLRKDGTVVAVGANHEKECEVSDWRNITSIAVSNGRTVGLRADGTVVAIGNNRNRECEVSSWKNIVAIASGAGCAWGIQSDGTLVAIGNNNNGQRDVSDWTDIVEISVGISHVVGLKADGTVIAAGYNNDGQCNVSEWTDIVAVAAGGNNTFGLKADGTVVVVGKNENGECGIGNWKLFKSEAEKEADYLAACALQQSGTEDALINASAAFAALKDYKDCAERSQTCRRLFAEKKASRERREKREVLVLEKNKLQAELTNLKGLFSGKRRNEIEARLAEIDTKLQKL